MLDETISSDQFRREVEEVAALLRSHGFQRAAELETDAPTHASVVYLGRNIAFTFTLDFRDQTADLDVAKVLSGRPCYSRSLFGHTS